jgi:hypothetical protein
VTKFVLRGKIGLPGQLTLDVMVEAHSFEVAFRRSFLDPWYCVWGRDVMRGMVCETPEKNPMSDTVSKSLWLIHQTLPLMR